MSAVLFLVAFLSMLAGVVGIYLRWMARGNNEGMESAGAGGYAAGLATGVLWVILLSLIEAWVR